eukprot:1161993-Pelagomonas_calceolata.AAC.4
MATSAIPTSSRCKRLVGMQRFLMLPLFLPKRLRALRKGDPSGDQALDNLDASQDAAANTQGDASWADDAQGREGAASAECHGGDEDSSSSEETESSGSESEGERDLKERLHQRRDVLQKKKLEALTHKTAHATLKVRFSSPCCICKSKTLALYLDWSSQLLVIHDCVCLQERDVQHMVASQRKREMKKEDIVRAGRNATKHAKGKGTRKTKGGGARGGADFAGWQAAKRAD